MPSKFECKLSVEKFERTRQWVIDQNSSVIDSEKWVSDQESPRTVTRSSWFLFIIKMKINFMNSRMIQCCIKHACSVCVFYDCVRGTYGLCVQAQGALQWIVKGCYKRVYVVFMVCELKSMYSKILLIIRYIHIHKYDLVRNMWQCVKIFL